MEPYLLKKPHNFMMPVLSNTFQLEVSVWANRMAVWHTGIVCSLENPL
jgi:hypothetical protein